MTSIKIIVGTETGTAEFVADDIQTTLAEQDIESEVLIDHNWITHANDLNSEQQTWLFCTSTHGAGELPGNLKPVFDVLYNIESLKNIRVGVIGLGDSSYDTFCKAALDIDALLTEKSATKLFDPILADAMSDDLPEDIIIPKLITHINVLRS